MSKVSLDKFIGFLERSNLIAPERLARVAGEWKRRASLAELDDARYFADHLVGADLLTRWQAAKLLDGRHRGFLLGKYKLLDHLGSGGMSSVYLAEHVLMQRLVAVKVLPQHRVSDSSYLARFHLEGQCAAALDHRNIVRAYDLDNEGKIHYLVMEYVEGHDLQAEVAHSGPLDFHAAAGCIAQAAAGLEHAHQAGLVHRDIKPANLLVDRHGTVKILDMGLAKFAAAKGPSSQLARDDQVLGTADYVAPEQTVNSSTVDHRADIYSLGCTLYFLLTGHPPFAWGSPAERIAAHQRRVPPSVKLDRPDAPEPLVVICQRMIEKSVENRYQTAGEVRAALESWLAAEAASGRVRPRAASIAAPGASLVTGERSGSAINLITGSNPDLGGSARDLAVVCSPFADTDANNIRGTERMPAPVPLRSSERAQITASKSHVLDSDLARLGGAGAGSSIKTPVPPPVVSPPIAPPGEIYRPGVPMAPATPQVTVRPVQIPIARPVESEGSRRLGRPGRSSRYAAWLWAIVLTATIVGAMLLALFVSPV
jgi:serine/threonine-protein kinase